MYAFLRFIGSQYWLRFGIRDRVIRRFCNPDQVTSVEFESDFFGFRYKGDLASYIDWSTFFYGAYERGNLLFLKSLVKTRQDKTGQDKTIFVDIGANVGVHSLNMSQFCSDVHSFEPNPVVRGKLEEKIRMNIVKNIVVHGVGVGMVNEELPYYAPKGCNQGTGSFIEGYSLNNDNNGILLKLVHGDEYFEKLRLDQIDIIKIDVEGFEKNVLLGLKKTLAKYRPIIFLEFSESTKQSFSDYDEFIDSFPSRYSVRRIVHDRPYMGIFNMSVNQLENFDFKSSGGDILIYPD